MAEKTCPTCGDQNVNIPSEIIACATNALRALHAYAEMIDERSYPMQPFVDLFDRSKARNRRAKARAAA